MTTRRSFLGSILAAGMAPAIVKAEILMPVKKIVVPKGYRRINGYERFVDVGVATRADWQRIANAFSRVAMNNIDLAANPPLVLHPNGKLEVIEFKRYGTTRKLNEIGQWIQAEAPPEIARQLRRPFTR